MGERVAKLTVTIPAALLNGARRACMDRETNLTSVVIGGLETFVANAADDRGMSVEVFCKKTVRLKAGRPRRG